MSSSIAVEITDNHENSSLKNTARFYTENNARMRVFFNYSHVEFKLVALLFERGCSLKIS